MSIVPPPSHRHPYPLAFVFYCCCRAHISLGDPGACSPVGASGSRQLCSSVHLVQSGWSGSSAEKNEFVTYLLGVRCVSTINSWRFLLVPRTMRSYPFARPSAVNCCESPHKIQRSVVVRALSAWICQSSFQVSESSLINFPTACQQLENVPCVHWYLVLKEPEYIPWSWLLNHLPWNTNQYFSYYPNMQRMHTSP